MPIVEWLKAALVRAAAGWDAINERISGVLVRARLLVRDFGSDALVVSDVYGADFGPPERTRDEASGIAGNGTEPRSSYEARADLEEFPRFLSRSARLSSAPHLALSPLSLDQDIGRDVAASRALTLSAVAGVVAVTAGACWLGTIGRADVATARHPQRNPAADAIAETFARAGSKASEATEPCTQEFCTGAITVGSSLKQAMDAAAAHAADAVLFEKRLAFVPHTVDLLSPPAPQTAMQEQRPYVEILSNGEKPADTGVVRIKNLPASAQLSAGTRIAATDWQLSDSEIDNLVVTLPRQGTEPVKAEIEIPGQNGAKPRTVAVAIASETPPVAASPPKKSRQKRRAQAIAAAASPPLTAPTETPSSAEASGTPAFSFFQGVIDKAKISPGPTSATEIMINLGVVPR